MKTVATFFKFALPIVGILAIAAGHWDIAASNFGASVLFWLPETEEV